MKNILSTLLLSALIMACSSTSKNIFSKKTPHEKYAEKLDDTDLEDTPEGRQWLAVSKTALEYTQAVKLPYRQNGYFAPDKPRALGLKFSAKRGEKITFFLNRKTPFTIYADLFKQKSDESSLVLSSDTAASQFSIAIDETGSYILRLQPELFQSGEYSLSVTVGPSLGFPVGQNKGKVGSVWGDSREGGKRRHEGIDIFAPKRTPVVAAADGIVTGVKNEGIGGKTVWLRTEKNISLYYAHLDEQLVTTGQLVKAGDILGRVGNTGNAKYTPPHLHFGIYTYAGPLDPLPFVNRETKTAAQIVDKSLKNNLLLTKAQKPDDGSGMIAANTILVPLASSATGYITEMPDGRLIQVPFASVQPVKSVTKKDEMAVKKSKTKNAG